VKHAPLPQAEVELVASAVPSPVQWNSEPNSHRAGLTFTFVLRPKNRHNDNVEIGAVFELRLPASALFNKAERLVQMDGAIVEGKHRQTHTIQVEIRKSPIHNVGRDLATKAVTPAVAGADHDRKLRASDSVVDLVQSYVPKAGVVLAIGNDPYNIGLVLAMALNPLGDVRPRQPSVKAA
jgi:hypothetical protein